MRFTQPCCAAFLAVALATSSVCATEKTPFSRRNPVVEAVQKTREGIVAIRVPRQGERDMIGSGVVFDERGLIVTNRHVTGGKKSLKVRFSDGTDVNGEVILTEPDLDLAVVRVNTNKRLKALTFAPTSDLMVGEDVIAIGNPYGYEGTVSRGIISALNREITMPNDVVISGLIQTDAPINPGNSGGPLVNINGEVIGINVAMRDGAQNIAFTINASTVKKFLNKHYSANRVAGIDHGIRCEEKVVAEMGDRQRVVVKAASHAELKAGDEIRLVAGCQIVNAFDVERSLWHSKPGQKVELKVIRQGKEVTVTMTLAASQGAGTATALINELPPSNALLVADKNVREANQR